MIKLEHPKVCDAIRKQLEVVREPIFGAVASGQGLGSAFSNAVDFFMKTNGFDMTTTKISIPIYFGEKSKDVAKKIKDSVSSLIKENYGYDMVDTGKSFYYIHNKEDILATIDCNAMATNYLLELNGESTFIGELETLLRTNLDINVSPQITRISLSQWNPAALQETKTKIQLPAHIDKADLLYPGMVSPSECWEKFSKADSRVMLLIGPPGTGKSSYFTAMLAARGWEQPSYIVDSQSAMEHPLLIENIRALPSGSLLIIEDADNFVGKREDGNKQMSGLLNLTSGIATADIRIGILTNLENVNKVDAALMRPGRCHKIMNFNLLDKEQANGVRDVLDLPTVEDEGLVSLSEIFNPEEAKVKPVSRFGFGAL